MGWMISLFSLSFWMWLSGVRWIGWMFEGLDRSVMMMVSDMDSVLVVRCGSLLWEATAIPGWLIPSLLLLVDTLGLGCYGKEKLEILKGVWLRPHEVKPAILEVFCEILNIFLLKENEV
ncbi:hypothetical protein KC19_12G118600 [Ceratodon purpureus]|uniref:Uncharacterized protein n=1 Tax=Ceratodon purpureus TaxID=3225 RepID=A0A8T0G678_CERPU|nr:hypothetical protein KC19_12G118600 [Ceratodon purpureus]